MILEKLDIVESFFSELDLKFPNHIWIVGVSGGGDSTFLAWSIKQALSKKKIFPAKIILVNVDHGQRVEASHEQQEIQKMWEDVFDVRVTKLNKGKLTENEMRQERMGFFENIAREYEKPALLLLGHNLTDRIETTILNLLRGAGIKGFLNMKKIDYQPETKKIKAIIRPLLDFSREDIREFLNAKGIKFFEDATNKNPSVSKRNLIREYINQFFNKYKFDRKLFYRSWLQVYEEIYQKIGESQVNLASLPPIWIKGEKHRAFKLIIDPLDFEVIKLQQLLEKMGIYQDITRRFLEEMMIFIIATQRGIKYFKGWNFIKHDRKLYLLEGPYKFWQSGATLQDMKRMYGIAILPPKGEDMLAQGLSVSKWIKKNKVPMFLKYILPVEKKNGKLYILKDKLGSFL